MRHLPRLFQRRVGEEQAIAADAGNRLKEGKNPRIIFGKKRNHDSVVRFPVDSFLRIIFDKL